jgi:hypothetical protein
MYEKWIQRNDGIHAPTAEPSKNETETLAQVRLLYEHDEQDRNTFSMPVERRLDEPL